MMSDDVECYAGSTYPEHPRAFNCEGHQYEVQEVLHRRREPDGVGFLVRCAMSDVVFDLFYFTESDTWLIEPK